MTEPDAPRPDAAMPAALRLSTAHRRRLREVWRSAGWPFQDPLEAELLAAGLLLRERDGAGRDTLRVSDAGVAALAQTLQRNRAARGAHEALVARVAREMQRAGRIVWRGLSLRARVGEAGVGGIGGVGGMPGAGEARTGRLPGAAGATEAATAVAAATVAAADGGAATDAGWLQPPPDAEAPGQWVMAMPDVYSIRHTTVEAYLQPVAHEIKVSRADLLSDLRKPAKGEAYRWLASECWYVIAEGIARAEEIPPDYGVLVSLRRGGLEVARPAPARAMRLPFGVWMALARATPEAADDEAQLPLVPVALAQAADAPDPPDPPPPGPGAPDGRGA